MPERLWAGKQSTRCASEGFCYYTAESRLITQHASCTTSLLNRTTRRIHAAVNYEQPAYLTRHVWNGQAPSPGPRAPPINNSEVFPSGDRALRAPRREPGDYSEPASNPSVTRRQSTSVYNTQRVRGRDPATGVRTGRIRRSSGFAWSRGAGLYIVCVWTVWRHTDPQDETQRVTPPPDE